MSENTIVGLALYGVAIADLVVLIVFLLPRTPPDRRPIITSAFAGTTMLLLGLGTAFLMGMMTI